MARGLGGRIGCGHAAPRGKHRPADLRRAHSRPRVVGALDQPCDLFGLDEASHGEGRGLVAGRRLVERLDKLVPAIGIGRDLVHGLDHEGDMGVIHGGGFVLNSEQKRDRLRHGLPHLQGPHQGN